MISGEEQSMGKPLARALGDFVAGLQFSQLPPQAVQVAKTGILDFVGVTVAGSQEPIVQILRRALTTGGQEREANIFGSIGGIHTKAGEAAWINGTAGHVLDYDDDIRSGHPSVAIAPAILAEGEVLDASGADIIAAYVAGYEVWMELMQREHGSY